MIRRDLLEVRRVYIICLYGLISVNGGLALARMLGCDLKWVRSLQGREPLKTELKCHRVIYSPNI